MQGTKKNIRPDIMLFVNGMPLVIIECKSPTLGEAWKAEALDQFSRYQELEERYRELGAPKLFETMQILVATCGQAAVYGTMLTPHRFYVEWKTPYPTTDSRPRARLGRDSRTRRRSSSRGCSRRRTCSTSFGTSSSSSATRRPGAPFASSAATSSSPR